MERSEFYQSLFERAKAAGFSACEAYYAAGESFSVTTVEPAACPPLVEQA